MKKKMIIIKRGKKTTLPPLASYRYGLPFVNRFLFIITFLLTFDSMFLVLDITVFKYLIFNLPLDLELSL